MSVAHSLTDAQIAGVFNRRLGRRHGVRLIGGASEPLYEPGSEGHCATIRYTRDYPASALHELAHWCIAGAARRQQIDYGYWYQPPPRTAQQQKAFSRAELPVQTLEARFARACGLRFRVSVDDVGGDNSQAQVFQAEVEANLCTQRPEDVYPRARELIAGFKQLREAIARPLAALKQKPGG